MKVFFITTYPANIPDFLLQEGSPDALLCGLLGLLCLGVLLALIQYRRVRDNP